MLNIAKIVEFMTATAVEQAGIICQYLLALVKVAAPELVSNLESYTMDFYLMVAKGEIDQKNLEDMYAFVLWAEKKGFEPGFIYTTLIHDVTGQVRKEIGFTPKTAGYGNRVKAVA